MQKLEIIISSVANLNPTLCAMQYVNEFLSKDCLKKIFYKFFLRSFQTFNRSITEVAQIIDQVRVTVPSQTYRTCQIRVLHAVHHHKWQATMGKISDGVLMSYFFNFSIFHHKKNIIALQTIWKLSIRWYILYKSSNSTAFWAVLISKYTMLT